MKKYILSLTLFALTSLVVGVPSSVRADACSGTGTQCTGQRTRNRGFSCEEKILPGSGVVYCSTNYVEGIVYCNADCRYNASDVVCASSTPPCTETFSISSGTCCGSGGGGGGGGGTPPGTCPAGQTLTPDPAYASRNPPYTSCQRTGCFGPSVQDQSQVCGYDSRGREKFICYRYICVTSSCNTTNPTNISVTRVSATSATINWTPGTGGTSQRVYMGANKAEVEANCPGTSSPACAVIQTGLPTSQSSYSTGSVLSIGTTYYVRVVNYKDSSCSSGSATAKYLSSCSLSPSAVTLTTGDSASIVASVNSSSEIQRIDFSSANPSIASVAPGSDSSYVYQTQVTGNQAGSTTVTGNVYFTGPTLVCTGQTTVNATNPGPWWQVKDSDIQSVGNLTSDIPAGGYFGLPGTGGYPGIPSYAGTSSLTNLTASLVGWIAQSTPTGAKVYNYAFFANQIPADTVITALPSNSVAGSYFESGGALSYGYYWYRYDGSITGLDLNITGAANLGTRKVVLLVKDADLYLQGNINLTDGQGFFGTFVQGNINVDPLVGGGGVPNLEGMYLADGSVNTGTGVTQLYVRGSVTGYGGISLQRNLANNSVPAELFEYAPDQILLFPTKLGLRKLNWKEVAP